MKPISQLFLFSLGKQRFGLDLNVVKRVERAVEITRLPEAPPLIAGIINYHGTILPVFDLNKKLGWPGKPVSAAMRFIIVSTPERPLVLVADSADGVISVKSDEVTASEQLEKELAQESFLKLEDGIIFIYDVERFLSSLESEDLGIALRKFDRKPEGA